MYTQHVSVTSCDHHMTSYLHCNPDNVSLSKSNTKLDQALTPYMVIALIVIPDRVTPIM